MGGLGLARLGAYVFLFFFSAFLPAADLEQTPCRSSLRAIFISSPVKALVAFLDQSHWRRFKGRHVGQAEKAIAKLSARERMEFFRFVVHERSEERGALRYAFRAVQDREGVAPGVVAEELLPELLLLAREHWHPADLARSPLVAALSPSAKEKLVEALIENAPDVLLRDLEHFGVPKERRYAFWERAAQSPSNEYVFRALESLRQAHWPEKLGADEFTPKERQALQVMAFRHNPLSVLESRLFQIEGLTPVDHETRLEDSPKHKGLKTLLREWAEARPHLIEPEHVSLLWDRVKKREVGFGLLRLIGQLKARGETIPQDSLQLLAKGLGFRAGDLEGVSYRDRALASLYEITLDLARHQDRPPFFKDSHRPLTLEREAA